ncbi:MAG: T9SS type A sorting domain-containing protein [Flavobacteriales bacterium]|nr:T9SS type A sorting domain-containing protein [Flavobacteriales bacterium]
MRTTLALVLCAASFSAFAQEASQESGAIVASGFHITRPLSEIFSENPVPEDFSPVRGESKDRLHREPPRYEFTGDDGPPYANDEATLQRAEGDERGAGGMKISFNGGTASGFRPYDPSGAAGPNHYVQMINSTTFRIYNKSTGALLLTGTLGNLWNPPTGNSGDPIVLYDKPANRWMLAQFGTSTDRRIYIAVSTTADPTGSYYTYTYTSPQFPDYLKFSVWHDGYYMTSNQSTQKVFAFERTAMLAGTPGARAVYVNYSPPKSGFFVPLPGCAADGTLPASGPCPIFSYSDNGWGTGFFDRVNVYNMTVNWVPATPTASIALAANITAAAFDGSYNASWNDCPQPGTTQRLDGIGGAMMYRAQWKTWNGYNTVVLNWAVRINSTQRGIKWCELRQNQSTGVWSMYQEGIYAPGTDTRWMGSICMDNNGSIGLSYLRSNSTSMYPSLYWTGRRSCDPLGTLPLTESLVVAGTGYQTGTNRVGDYAHQCLDPDGVTFWSTSEYMGGTSGASAARTRIFSYQITPCSNAAGVSIALTGGTNPTCTGAGVTFTATPTNGGTSPSYQWRVNGANVGTNSPTFTTSALTNGAVVTCVMTSNLAGVTGNPATSNAITMTVSGTVTPAVSIAITAGSNPTNSGSSVTFTATPTNGGTSPGYQWRVNGANVGTNSATYTTTTLTNGAVVSCVMTSNSPCASPTTATSNSITMTVNTVVTYCTAGTSNTAYERITNVSMGSINNPSGASSYSNFTNLSTTVSVGVAQSITVTIGNPYSTDRVLIWCDWNRNGTLTDAGEAVYASPQGVGPFTTSITAPTGTTAGAVRMRIRLTDAAAGANLTPCGTSTYGEVEDYTLNVTGTLAPVVVADAPPQEVSSVRMETLDVFPNPSAGECTVRASSPGTYYLLNEQGVLVRSFTITGTQAPVQLTDLASGTYVISGQTATGIVKRKLIVNR